MPNGQFYKASYEGYYSAREETFLTEKDRLPDGTFDPRTTARSSNWWRRIIISSSSDQQAWLIDYIEENPAFIAARNPPQRGPRLPQKQ